MENDHLDHAAAMLCLHAAILWASDHGQSTAWGEADWRRLVAGLSPREIMVVARKGIRGMTQNEVADWLGVSRGRVDQHWRAALLKMRTAAARMVA